jgi:glycerate kinase
MRVLAAPDKFRGTLTAAQAAGAIARGWLRTSPGDEVEEIPMADGGEGTLDAMVAALGGELHSALVSGPLGEPVDAPYGIADGPRGRLAVVEMARASGLALVPEDARDPLRATTRGTGELILAACAHAPREVIVCIGGSASTDGGAGMAQALGVHLLDGEGEDLAPGGASLARLAAIDAGPLAEAVRGVRFVVASDVDNPLVGPRGAAAVYGPQKGASPRDVEMLDSALSHFAEVVVRDLGADVRDRPGAGAAGGLGAGLMAFLGAQVRSGVEVVMEAVGLEARLAGASLIISGEGKVDEQSTRGKVPAGVIRAAREARVPVVIVCGRVEIELEGARVASLEEAFGLERSLGDAEAALEDLVADLAADPDAAAILPGRSRLIPRGATHDPTE